MKRRKSWIYIIVLLLAVSAGFISGRVSKEFEIGSENLSRRAGSYQLWGVGETISASVGIENEFWYSEPGDEGVAVTFSCELEPIDDYLFLINSDHFDYNLVSVKEGYLLLVDTDNNNIMKIDKVSNSPTKIINE